MIVKEMRVLRFQIGQSLKPLRGLICNFVNSILAELHFTVNVHFIQPKTCNSVAIKLEPGMCSLHLAPIVKSNPHESSTFSRHRAIKLTLTYSRDSTQCNDNALKTHNLLEILLSLDTNHSAQIYHFLYIATFSTLHLLISFLLFASYKGVRTREQKH